jgi:hypothetical protein
VIDDESLVKTRTNTCLSYTSAVPSYSVFELAAYSSSIWHLCIIINIYNPCRNVRFDFV